MNVFGGGAVASIVEAVLVFWGSRLRVMCVCFKQSALYVSPSLILCTTFASQTVHASQTPKSVSSFSILVVIMLYLSILIIIFF